MSNTTAYELYVSSYGNINYGTIHKVVLLCLQATPGNLVLYYTFH